MQNFGGRNFRSGSFLIGGIKKYDVNSSSEIIMFSIELSEIYISLIF